MTKNNKIKKQKSNPLCKYCNSDHIKSHGISRIAKKDIDI